MLRRRWHDALVVVGILGLLAAGVWALWWGDLRSVLWREAGSEPPARTVLHGQT